MKPDPGKMRLRANRFAMLFRQCAKPGSPFLSICRLPVNRVTLVLVVFCALSGCSREAYRKLADRDAYRLIQSRQSDQRWEIPFRTVEPSPESRLADPNHADCGPIPADDPAASCYMERPYNSRRRVEYWDERGRGAPIDSEQWLAALPYNEQGKINVDQALAMDLALMHSRTFQSQVEQLYNQALFLSSNRFEYQLNWFGGSGTNFNATEDGFDAVRDVTTNNRLGFSRNLATGGQFAVSLLNSFAWNFGGSGNSNFSAGNLVFNLTQPILRGAFRHVRTESLTQSERTLLYSVRDFARFRRQFYLDIVSRYLNLLNQAQGIRIEKENLRNLELSLEEHEVLYDNGRVSPIQVDQIFQRYQSGRLSLINSEQSLQSSLDQFKFQLGLPAKIPIELDESILESFQLNSTEVEQLQDDVDQFKLELMQYLPPDEAPVEFLNRAEVKLERLSDQIERLKKSVDLELEQWQAKLKSETPGDDATEDDRIDFRQQQSLLKRIQELLQALEEQIENANKDPALEEAPDDDIDEPEAIKKWRAIQMQLDSPGGIKDRVSTLFVTQTQIRLFLIEIKPLEIEEQTAVEIALENRLDLMNSRGNVVDAYRQVEIAADQLESDLSVQASADLQTDPTVDNAFRFDGDENQYRIGIQLDGPLNRLNERNGYRSAQIRYQQQRRAYMADEDAIVNSVRQNLRELQTNRFNFRIARQQLITATRQVEQAQFNLRTAVAGDSSLTQDVLQALQSLRDTKNSLISSWIRYEISRIALFVDLELLMLGERGEWINESQKFDSNPSGSSGGSQPAQPGTLTPAAEQPEFIEAPLPKLEPTQQP